MCRYVSTLLIVMQVHSSFKGGFCYPDSIDYFKSLYTYIKAASSTNAEFQLPRRLDGLFESPNLHY